MSDSEPSIQDRIATEIGSFKAEILEAIDTNFERIHDVLRLRSAPEAPAEAERDEAPSAVDFADALVRSLTKQEDKDNG